MTRTHGDAAPRPERSRTVRSLSTDRVEVPFSARFHFARSGRHPDGRPVEGLRTIRKAYSREACDEAGAHEARSVTPPAGRFSHEPVMVAEVVSALTDVPPGVVLDATVGGGGHAAGVLDAHPGLRVVGIDQDPEALAAAAARLERYGERAVLARARFDRLDEVLDGRGISTLSGALFDLGVSSHQLDSPRRGFSYAADGPLDMRMDPSTALSAAQVVNTWDPDRLERLFRENGETRFARRIARAVVDARPLTSTAALASVVRDAIPAPARRRGGHPARRVFQAIRIAVNEELRVLPGALDAAIARLVPGGRCLVLAYHSGEDRIVKERFRFAETGGCVCPPGLPCVCGATPLVRVLTRGARKPSAAEVARNHRAESARLRVAERIEPGGAPR